MTPATQIVQQGTVYKEPGEDIMQIAAVVR